MLPVVVEIIPTAKVRPSVSGFKSVRSTQAISSVSWQPLEQELGDEQFCFVEGCQRSWDELPAPHGPLTVGIDGGYLRGQRKQGQFEVIAGKSLLAFKRDHEGKQQLSGRCFAWVQTYDEKPKRPLSAFPLPASNSSSNV
jgi:hypothetical protein